MYGGGVSKRHYSYRFIFVPEGIGAIAYLSENLDTLKKNVRAGFNLTCVGDNNSYSYLKSLYGDTLADRVLANTLKFKHPEYKTYPHTQSGSDERKYNSPGIELPVVCFSRSLYGEYPEYHTSADNMDYISPEGLQGSFDVMVDCINALENNTYDTATCKSEPQLGKRGLYPTLSRKGHYDTVFAMINYLQYANGKQDLVEISNLINVPVGEIVELRKKLVDAGLVKSEWR